MRSLLIASCTLAIVAAVIAVHPNDPNWHAEINAAATTWTAGHNEIWESLHESEIDDYLGLMSPTELRGVLGIDEFPSEEAPEDYVPAAAFDVRDLVADDKCDFPIRDQGRCGSCWAFGTAEAITQRFCVHTDGAHQTELSTQVLVSCDKYGNFGCKGGIPALAYAYVGVSGLPADSCHPYTSGTTGKSGSCKDLGETCEDGSTPEVFKIKKASIRVNGNPASVQAALEKGAVTGGFNVYEDFLTYTGGIYKHTTGDVKGGHAIEILGWGSEDGTDYWLCANSWSSKWGDKGFFKIAFEECGIDSQVVSAMPSL